MIDTTDYGDGAVRLWCDKYGRRLGEGESLLLTEDRWHGRWEWIPLDEPTKYHVALSMDGWRPIDVGGRGHLRRDGGRPRAGVVGREARRPEGIRKSG